MAVVENYPSNSHKSRDEKEQKKREPVVTSGVKKQEKSAVEKAKNEVFATDARDVKDYILHKVVGPKIRRLVVEVGNTALGMLILGDDWSPSRSSGGTRIHYNDISKRRDDDDYTPRTRRSTYDYEDLIFETERDAQRVLEEMCDILDAVGYVTIGDMYDAAKQPTLSTDYNYGWRDLRNAKVRPVEDGYIISLDRCRPVK